MIPYFELRTIPIVGDVSLAVFGTLVVLGVVVGVFVAESRARVVGIPRSEIHGAILWSVVPGFVLAHLVAWLPHAHNPAAWSPKALLGYWNGMSSFGGFAGALLGLALFYRGGRRPWLGAAEVLLQALVVGWLFGRLGCTLVHDHVGTPSSFWLAIRFPDGPRHDLGLYEFLYTSLVLFPAILVVNRRVRPAGSTIVVIALLYAPARFLADFLRDPELPGADGRYLGLTVAQHGCIVLAGVGLVLAWQLRLHSGRTIL
jgi:phosphatidylglycerol:prolipoprotein diacylglycerol transferase